MAIVTDLIITLDLSISIVDRPTFIDLMQMINSKFTMTSRKIIPSLYDNMNDQIKKLLFGCHILIFSIKCMNRSKNKIVILLSQIRLIIKYCFQYISYFIFQHTQLLMVTLNRMSHVLSHHGKVIPVPCYVRSIRRWLIHLIFQIKL